MSKRAKNVWKGKNESEQSRTVRGSGNSSRNRWLDSSGYLNDRSNKRHKKFKKLVEDFGGVWNCFYPPIESYKKRKAKFNITRSYKEDQEEEAKSIPYPIKPDLETQFQYIQTEGMYDWRNIGKNNNPDDPEFSFGRELTNEKKPSISQINLFDEIFSPTVFVHEKSEELKKIFQSLDKTKFISESKSKELYELSSKVRERMIKRKEKALKEIEETIDEQINLFEMTVMKQFGDRFKILSKVDSQHFEEKIKNQFIIKNKNVETPFTKIIKSCSDTFEIIFSYLKTPFLLHKVSLTSTYFYYLIKNEIPIRVDLTLPLVRDLVLHSDSLSNYRIGGIDLRRDKYFGPFKFNGIKEASLYSKIISQHAINLRYLSIHQKIHTKVSLEKVKKIAKQQKEEEEEELKVNRSYLRRKRRIDRYYHVSTTRKYFSDSIMKCKNLESFKTKVLPSSILNLHYLTCLEYDIFSEEKPVLYTSQGMEDPEKDSKKNSDLQILIEYFSECKRPKIRKLNLTDRTTGSYQCKDLQVEETLKQISLLYDSIAMNCPNLEFIELRLLFGLKTFSFKFIDSLVKVRTVKLVFWGHNYEKKTNDFLSFTGTKIINEEEEETKKKKKKKKKKRENLLDLYTNKIEYLAKAMKYRNSDNKNSEILNDFVVHFHKFGPEKSGSGWSGSLGVSEEDGDFFRRFAYHVPEIKLETNIERILGKKEGAEGEVVDAFTFSGNQTLKCLIGLFDQFSLSDDDNDGLFTVCSKSNNDGRRREFKCKKMEIDVILSNPYSSQSTVPKMKQKKSFLLLSEEEEEEEEELREEPKNITLEIPMKETFKRMFLSSSSDLKSMSFRIRYRQYSGCGLIMTFDLPSMIFSSFLENKNNSKLEELRILIFYSVGVEKFEIIKKLFEDSWLPHILRILELNVKKNHQEEEKKESQLRLKKFEFILSFNTQFPKKILDDFSSSSSNPHPPLPNSREESRKRWEFRRKKNLELSRTNHPQVSFLNRVKLEIMENVLVKKFGDNMNNTPQQVDCSGWEKLKICVSSGWRRLSFEKYLDGVVVKDIDISPRSIKQLQL